MKANSLMITGMALLLAAARAAAALAPAPAAAAGGLNVTSAANAMQGLALYPQVSVLTNVIRTEPAVRDYLSEPRDFTGFVPVDNSTKELLHSIGRYAGVALQNDTFVKAIFDYMTVPGKAWSVEELRKAAPVTVKTALAGEDLRITRDPKAPYGIRINGFRVSTADQATKDRRAVLHMLDGVLIPDSQRPLVDQWLKGSSAAAGGGGVGDEASGAAGAGGGAEAPAPAAAGRAESGARRAARAAGALAAAAAAVAALL